MLRQGLFSSHKLSCRLGSMWGDTLQYISISTNMTVPTERHSTAVHHLPFRSKQESIPENILDGFHELVGYFPSRKRPNYERHVFQRFLLVLRGNSSFYFLYCITLLWCFKGTTLTPHPGYTFSLLPPPLSASLHCLAATNAPKPHKLKRLQGSSTHFTLLKKDHRKTFTKGPNNHHSLPPCVVPTHQDFTPRLKCTSGHTMGICKLQILLAE